MRLVTSPAWVECEHRDLDHLIRSLGGLPSLVLLWGRRVQFTTNGEPRELRQVKVPGELTSHGRVNT